MNGECNCMDNYAGEKCFECSPGHYDSDSTSAMNCSGKINHHRYFFWNWLWTRDNIFSDCGCHYQGTMLISGTQISMCNNDTGSCDCQDGYLGEKCDMCAAGYFNSNPYARSGTPVCLGMLHWILLKFH